MRAHRPQSRWVIRIGTKSHPGLYADPRTDADTRVNRNRLANPDPNANRNRLADADALPNVHPDTGAYLHAQANANQHSQAHQYSASDQYSAPHTNPCSSKTRWAGYHVQPPQQTTDPGTRRLLALTLRPEQERRRVRQAFPPKLLQRTLPLAFLPHASFWGARGRLKNWLMASSPRAKVLAWGPVEPGCRSALRDDREGTYLRRGEDGDIKAKPRRSARLSGWDAAKRRVPKYATSQALVIKAVGAANLAKLP